MTQVLLGTYSENLQRAVLCYWEVRIDVAFPSCKDFRVLTYEGFGRGCGGKSKEITFTG